MEPRSRVRNKVQLVLRTVIASAVLLHFLETRVTEGATISNSTDSSGSIISSTTLRPYLGLDYEINADGDRFNFARDNDFSDQDQIDQQQKQKTKRKRRRRPLPNVAATESSFSVSSVLPKIDAGSWFSNEIGTGTGRSCGSATVATTTVSPNINNLLGGEAGLIGGGLVAKAIAVAIGIGIIVVKIIIAAIIAWWWYGGDKKGGGDEGYGWSSPAPVYGPPMPVYGAPQPTYGAPVSGYGRQLYESLDFSKLSENVLRALDFFEKYYYSNSNEVDIGTNAGLGKTLEKKVLNEVTHKHSS